ncbi:25S rRNA (adenine(645)-N(1))-methyltransferase [Trifolium repens]|nr:25S rRNA (adenine(645)-N(1))-methyltransferase [Trifolium repens]
MNNKKRKRHTKNDPSNKDKEIPSKSNQPSKSSNFLEKMRARLSGGHFRMINEKLYTCTYVIAAIRILIVIFELEIIYDFSSCFGNKKYRIR